MYTSSIGGLGDTDSPSVIAQINKILATTRKAVDSLAQGVNERLDAAYCNFGISKYIPTHECYRVKQDLANLYKSIDRLEDALSKPAAGESTPVVLAHPQRALEVVDSYTESVLAQAQILARWAERTDVVNILRNTFTTLKQLVREAVKKVGEVATEAGAGALSTTSGWIFTGLGILALAIYFDKDK